MSGPIGRGTVPTISQEERRTVIWYGSNEMVVIEMWINTY